MIPFIRQFEVDYGRADQLSAKIWRVVARNPGPFTFTGTGTYLIGDARGVAVIDPGPDDEAHIEAILRASPGPITDILVTHTHRDHSAGVPRLKATTGATVYAYGQHPSSPDEAPMPLDEGADFEFTPDTRLQDGQIINGENYRLEAIHTPGHTENHLCFAFDEEATLFTGDHIMGWSTTVIAPPDGNMAHYLASLDRLSARLQDKRFLPTHGAPIDQPHAFVDAIRAHRLARDKAIVEQVGTEPISVMAIVEAVYTDTDKRLYPAAALNVMAHLEQHIHRGTIIALPDRHYRRG